jgi:hypothetical protein
MNILINHCWCSDSIWGGEYNCRCIVSLDRVPDGKTYYDPPCPDWTLVEEHPHQSSNRRDRTETLRPRADVLEWLKTNVKDRKLTKYERDQGDSLKGWAIGTDEYNASTGISFSFFFERQMDGMRFIRHWSHHRNPVSYLQYFKDIRKELDLATGKLKKVAR